MLKLVPFVEPTDASKMRRTNTAFVHEVGMTEALSTGRLSSPRHPPRVLVVGSCERWSDCCRFARQTIVLRSRDGFALQFLAVDSRQRHHVVRKRRE